MKNGRTENVSEFNPQYHQKTIEKKKRKDVVYESIARQV
jgi:hypothetical protein